MAAVHHFGERVISIYRSAMTLRWHVRFHLQNKRKPVFDLYGPMHESYAKFEQELDDEVKKIIEGARTIDRSAFEKKYDVTQFKRSVPSNPA